MKKFLLSATTFAMATTSINAGTLTEPIVEEVMEPEMAAKGSSSGGVLVPLLLLGVVAALIASSKDDEDGCVENRSEEIFCDDA